MLDAGKVVLLTTIIIGMFLLLGCSPLQPEEPQSVDTATPSTRPARTATLSVRPTSTAEFDKAEDPLRQAQDCWQRWQDSRTDQDYQCATENIVKAIHVEPREEYVEFLYAVRLENPPPTIPVGAVMDIYTDTIDTARFFTQTETTAANLSLSETQIPALVHSGERALRLQWDKPTGQSAGQWASLIIGFDPDIQNRDKAIMGQMKRLSIDESKKDSYMLEFWIMGAEGGGAIAVKLQDQNPVITESIGCQVVYPRECQQSNGNKCEDPHSEKHVCIFVSNKWEKISIPLQEFYLDCWISPKEEVGCKKEDYVEKHYWKYGWYERFLEFEWDGIKQINFDPCFYSDSGIVYFDDIRLVKVAE